MIELPLIFLGGLLGSAHCVGMCGGFALLLGASAANVRANVLRQLVYSLGRIFTYAVGGGVLGYAGLRLVGDLPSVVNLQAVLAILAGVLLVIQGALSAGLVPRRLGAAAYSITWLRPALATPGQSHALGLGCAASGALGSLLRAPGLRNSLLAGMFTGFLPCGLVYAYLALAASSSDLLLGSATMIVFGLGTVPLMVLAGTGASLVSVATRVRLLRLAAWCVLLTGLVSLARGFGYLELPGHAAPQSCPFCQSE